MQKRKSHQKSRRGCLNCKRRHVKCDELGPPCAACIARHTTSTCEYSVNRPAKPPSPSKSLENAPSTSKTPDTSPDKMVIDENSEEAELESESRRLLELELMHQWTASTWKSMSSSDIDAPYLQFDTPRAALTQPFLMHGILSISALEMAVTERQKGITAANTLKFDKLIRATLIYYDLSSKYFREKLSNIDAENIHCLYMNSLILAAINLALPQAAPVQDESNDQQTNILDRMSALYELMQGASSVVAVNWSWMEESPLQYAFEAAMVVFKEEAPEYDDATKAALAALASIIKAELPTTDPVDGVDTAMQIGLTTAGASISLREPYRKAVAMLDKCFKEDVKGIIRGFCVAFPMFAGPGFADAFRNREPVALFMTMYWGTLLHRTGDSTWWVGSFGRSLVLEISEMLRSQTNLTAVPEWQEGITWARGKVGYGELV